MRDLEVLYDQVPATRCAGTGDCCALTDEEFDTYYATMFPLYRAEYVHIVAYVERHFSPQRRQELLSFTEERPRRCPFLGADHSCTIYPVRPLICRTYGAMNPVSIARQALAHQGDFAVGANSRLCAARGRHGVSAGGGAGAGKGRAARPHAHGGDIRSRIGAAQR